MHSFCFTVLLLSLLFGFGVAAYAAVQAGRGRFDSVILLEKTQMGLASAVLCVSAILLYALATRDFSYVYVRDYTDTFLPLFYAVTAFWAGQNGSFLFWYAAVTVMGCCVIFSPAYLRLDRRARTLFWLLFFLTEFFFLYVLTGPGNPFLRLEPVPTQGHGLNPLLQNPGMIFHPPLLFLGYAAYTVPACFALVSRICGDGQDWLETTRNWNILAWIFLTAGIVLGAWWSYMELGWGGYWAWDPVENASLIPWLAGTAFLHTAIVGRTRQTLLRTNVFLIGLTFLLCFYATFVVRSGFIDSLHAFGGSRMGVPLLMFMLGCLTFLLWTCLVRRADDPEHLDDFFSRPGLLFLGAWVLLCLAIIVFFGVNWPVLSVLWSAESVGLDAGFYNRVCLPLFAGLAFIMGFCPWLGQKGGWRDLTGLFWSFGVASLLVIISVFWGYRAPLAVFGALSGFLVLATIIVLFVRRKGLRHFRPAWGAYGVHFGIGLMVIGIAFSAGYKKEVQGVLRSGEALRIGEYTLIYENLIRDAQNPGMVIHEAHLRVLRDGQEIGQVAPQKRAYRNFERGSFSEVSVVPSLGNEVYTTLLGFNEAGSISLKVSINPLVNWIWIGGTICCLVGFLCWRRIERRPL